MESQKPTVVIIESDEYQRYLYDIALRFQKLNVVSVSTIVEGLKKIDELEPELILVDEVVTDFHNLNLLEELEQRVPDKLPAIIVTNLREDSTREIEQDKIIKAIDFLVSDKDTIGEVIRTTRKDINL